MSSDACVIEIERVSKCYTLYDRPSDRLRQFFLPRFRRLSRKIPEGYYREFWALRDVSLVVSRGETIGIIGKNGAGKSTLLQVICGTLTPTSGKITVKGRVAALLELGAGFNPDFTGLENVKTYATILGLSQDALNIRLDDILSFADIGDYVHQPVKTYSTGMMVRLAFAVASAVEPEVLVVDEALSVGDLAFQNKCLRRIERFIDSGGTTLFVSHSMQQVSTFCSRAYWIHDGKVRETGTAKSVVNRYVNFMRDGYEAQSDVPAQTHSMTSEWIVIEASNDYDSREGHMITAFMLSFAETGAPLSAVFNLPARVRLRLQIKTSGVNRPLIGVGFFGALNLPVVHFNSSAVGVDLHPLEDGLHEIDIEFQLPVIADGEYIMHLGIDDGEPGESVMLCHVRSAYTLTVACRKRAGFRQYGIVPVDEGLTRIEVRSTCRT